MSKTTKATIEVQGIPIAVLSDRNEDFISLTDMLKAKDGDFYLRLAAQPEHGGVPQHLGEREQPRV